MTSLNTFLAVFLGGGLGSLLRYSTSLLVHMMSLRIWLATLAVNVIGAFVIAIATYKLNLTGNSSAFLRVGLLGGLTTFSSFSLEVVNAYRSGNPLEAALILFLNIFFGIVVSIWIFR